MRIVIAGGHGKIGRLLGQALTGRGDSAVGIVRNPDQVADLQAIGVEPVVADLEHTDVATVAEVLTGADAVVFSAGAGAGSGAARKDTVDRAAAVLVANACDAAGVRRYLLVSSMGVDSVRDGATPGGRDAVFVAYLRAKLAAEEELLARDSLDLTVVRPGGLTDDPGTGRVHLDAAVPRGSVSRADVAAVLVALLDHHPELPVLELVGGDTPVTEAVAGL